MADEGPQSSDDGSAIHSPIYDSDSFSRPDHFRYPDQIDIGLAATQFSGYSTSVVQPGQPPLIDTTLQAPRNSGFQPRYSDLPRGDQGYFSNAQPSAAAQRLSPSSQPPNDAYYYGRQTAQSFPSRTMDYSSYHRLPNAPTVASIPLEHPPSVPSSVHVTESSMAPAHEPNRHDRKQISSVVIACRQCRGRKIKCDSTRPVCNNCVRRSNVCEYDAAPRRRGPDKRPGTRHRSCKKRPVADTTTSSSEPPAKRQRADPTSSTAPQGSQQQLQHRAGMANNEITTNLRPHDFHQPVDLRISTDFLPVKEEVHSPYQDYGYGTPFSRSTLPRPIDPSYPQSVMGSTHSKFPPPTSPVIESVHRDWWDQFLNTSGYSLQDLESHTRYLFSDTGHNLDFLNVDSFVRTLYTPDRRHTIQPALMLAVLATSTLMKSSNIEQGEKGRRDAIQLRDAANQALQATVSSSEWVDAAVAGAALILCLFESSAHPHHDPSRHISALTLLSDLIHNLALTTIDRNDPDVSRFAPNSVPGVQLTSKKALSKHCQCIPSDAQEPPDTRSTWSYPLPWDPSWTDSQIKDEECRRLCWSALGMVASHSVHAAALDDQEGVENYGSMSELWICDPANYAILFPGEAIDRASPTYRSADAPSPKESISALYCRSMLLWVFCHYRLGRCEDGHVKAEWVQEVMGEAQFLQESLDFHVCNLDTELIYLTREYISK
ncbi:hypothetical protein PQX77_000889 [Marasmius sp. AFHP31]|nr:hypothetical protein PQX77_000889 [Marasmius sp. AFHP31]